MAAKIIENERTAMAQKVRDKVQIICYVDLHLIAQHKIYAGVYVLYIPLPN
jgi:hypothetical protein